MLYPTTQELEGEDLVGGVDHGDGHMTLPVKCQEQHGYVMVDLQHIVSDLHLVHTGANEC